MPSTDTRHATSLPARYDSVAIALHWIIALAFLSMLAIGFVMNSLPPADAWKFPLFQFHKSLGFTILGGVCLRLLWRLTHTPPALPTEMPTWERWAAEATHWVLYAILFAMPLSGWIIVSHSAFNFPTLYFGLFEIPHLSGVDFGFSKQQIEGAASLFHELLAFSACGLIALHAGAALRHHFALKDTVLRRMLPQFGKGTTQ
ncbi:MAG: cytochrome b [Parvibaculaceae bacterium]|nr:cytochrome b [Parvibaculaceae bacterium]